MTARDYKDRHHTSGGQYDDSPSNRRPYSQRRNRDVDETLESSHWSQQKPPQDQRRNDNDYGQQREDKQSETLCIGSWTYGHPVEECTKTGAHIAIDAFLQQCSDQTKKEIKAAYRKNWKEAHERYLCAYKHRQELRKKIRRLEYQHNHDSTGSVTQQDQATLAELDGLKISCIRMAHDENSDIEFGSLDHHYVDK